jgi:hypothetical protein
MTEPIPIVDGLDLAEEVRALLRPGEAMQDYDGRTHRLPRFFYRIDNWGQAKTTKLTAHFTVAELMAVDCREADLLLRQFPHYVPCAISVLARYLEEFRNRVGAAVSVGVNGGYRSPAHRFSRAASPHLWGAAANIYRIGNGYLDSQKMIDRYAAIAADMGQEVFVKPYGPGPGESDDHLHLDLGYLHWAPRQMDEAARFVTLA